MASLFLFYRRSDSQDVVGRIYDKLTAHFPHERIFRDLDSIPLGKPFPEVIREAVGKSAAALVIIGPGWVAIGDDSGKRRLNDPGDFVRIEVELALSSGILVIPVLVSGARMPKAKELPTALRPLVSLQSIQVRADPDFHRDMERLISRLSSLFEVELRGVQPDVGVAVGQIQRDELAYLQRAAARLSPYLRAFKHAQHCLSDSVKEMGRSLEQMRDQTPDGEYLRRLEAMKRLRELAIATFERGVPIVNFASYCDPAVGIGPGNFNDVLAAYHTMAAECAPLITEAADLHQAVQQESWLPWDWSHTLLQWVSEIQRQAHLIGNEIAAMKRAQEK